MVREEPLPLLRLLLQAALHSHPDGGGGIADGAGDVSSTCLGLPSLLPPEHRCQGPDQHLGQRQSGVKILNSGRKIFFCQVLGYTPPFNMCGKFEVCDADGDVQFVIQVPCILTTCCSTQASSTPYTSGIRDCPNYMIQHLLPSPGRLCHQQHAGEEGGKHWEDDLQRCQRGQGRPLPDQLPS